MLKLKKLFFLASSLFLLKKNLLLLQSKKKVRKQPTKVISECDTTRKKQTKIQRYANILINVISDNIPAHEKNKTLNQLSDLPAKNFRKDVRHIILNRKLKSKHHYQIQNTEFYQTITKLMARQPHINKLNDVEFAQVFNAAIEKVKIASATTGIVPCIQTH